MKFDVDYVSILKRGTLLEMKEIVGISGLKTKFRSQNFLSRKLLHEVYITFHEFHFSKLRFTMFENPRSVIASKDLIS